MDGSHTYSRDGWIEGVLWVLKKALVALVMVGHCGRVHTVLAGREMR
jgi:hypothetical protein